MDSESFQPIPSKAKLLANQKALFDDTVNKT
jgi:hypothetical protein